MRQQSTRRRGRTCADEPRVETLSIWRECKLDRIEIWTVGGRNRRCAPATETLFAFRDESEPVSRRRWTNRWTHARMTPNVAATSSASPLASHARATHSRKSIEYGAIVTSARNEYHGWPYYVQHKTAQDLAVQVLIRTTRPRD